MNIWTQNLVNRNCPSCGQNNVKLISQRMRDKINLNTVICKNCALVYSNPVPPEDLYYRFYTEAYNNYYETEPKLQVPEKCPLWVQIKLNLIQNYLPDTSGKILEIGPGNGSFLYWLQKIYPNAIGIEPGPNILYSMEKCGLKAIHGFFDQYPFEPSYYNMIVMFHVLEHFYEPNHILEKCYELLDSNGFLFIEVPNIHKPFRSLDNYFLRYVHLVNYSEETIETMLCKHSFKILKIETTSNSKLSPNNLRVIAQKTTRQKREAKKNNYEKTIKILANYRVRWYLYNKYIFALIPNYYKLKDQLKKALISTSFGKWLKRGVLNKKS